MPDLIEQKLKDALAFAESIVDTMRDPLLVLDKGLRVISASREFYRTFGVTPAETEGQPIYQLGNGQWNIPRLRTFLEEILPQNTTFRDFEVEHVFEHIGRKTMLLNARKLYREQNKTERIVLVLEDVTQRRDAEKARHEAETRFTEMVKNVRDHAIFLTDPQGIITSWNVAAERVIGYTEAEVVGKHFSIIFVPEDLQHGIPELELRTAREQGRAEDERWHLRKDGSRFWALGIVTPLHDTDGQLTGFSKILRDMTGRKRLEGSLQASEERFRRVVEGSHSFVMFTMNASGMITTWNPAAEVLLGWTAMEATGQSGGLIFTPEDRVARKHEQEMATAVNHGRAADERWHIKKDGTRFWGSGELTALHGPGGELQGFVKVMRDDTVRKLAETRLRESEERLRVALAAGKMGTWLWRIGTNEQILDDGLRRLMGLTRGDEVMSLERFLLAIDEEDRVRVRNEFERAVREHSEMDIEFRVTWSDGSRHWLKDQGKVFIGADNQPLFLAGACVDMTDRKRMEEELRQAHDNLEAQVKERTAKLSEVVVTLEAEVARRATVEHQLLQRTEELRQLMGEILVAEQRERHRVAKILHDHLQQSLVAAEFHIGSIIERNIKEIEEDTSRIEELLGECLKTSRTLTVDLSPPVLQGGLVAALEWLVRSMADRHGLVIQFEKVEDVPEVPDELKILLFESVRELLLNVVKHAGTMQAKVEISIDKDKDLCVTVSDEGQGFDPARVDSARQNGGFGFFSIQERVERMGGRMETRSAPGRGSRITLIVPLKLSSGD